MAIKHQRQFLVEDNPSRFDNGFGGARIGEPYDGSTPYQPFTGIGLSTDRDLIGGGGVGGSTYNPPTPTNPTFVPPSTRQDLLNKSIIINLLAESLLSSEKIDVEFLENDIQKGISSNLRIVYSPAISFGSKKIYKAFSQGKILTNYYEVDYTKTFIGNDLPVGDVLRWRPGIEQPVIDQYNYNTGRYPYFNQENGTYDFNFEFNRGNGNTPFTRLEEIYTENIQVTEYTLQDDGNYTVSSTKMLENGGDVINLTFYFREKKPNDTPIDEIPLDTESETEYEIAYASNFGLEVTELSLKYSIENGSGDIIRDGILTIEEGTDLQKINYTELKNGKVSFSLVGKLPDEYKIKTVYKNKLVGVSKDTPIDITTWQSVPQQFEIPINELKYGVGVIVELEKLVSLNAPKLLVPQNQYEVQVQESELEKGIRIPFITDTADTVTAYINKDKSVQVNAIDKEIILYFQKDFDEVYGSKKVILVANSKRFGTSAPVEIIIKFVAVHDFPSITEINYPQFIDVPSFSDFNIDYKVTFNALSATSVDVDIRKKDKTLINLFKNLPSKGDFTINVKKLTEQYPDWNNGDNNIIIVLRPYNRGGAESLTGNDYEIVTNIKKASISLDETIIESALMQVFSEGLLIVPEKENKYLSHLLNFGNNEQVLISSWEEDSWTLSEKQINRDGIEEVVPGKEVKSLLLKLYSPLPPAIQTNSTSWVTKLLSNPLVETILLTEELVEKCPPIKGPNFNIEINLIQGQGTGYESFDDLIFSGSSSTEKLIQNYKSGSLIDWKNLNIEYASGSNPLNAYQWNNFVHFSSAKERLDNFVYKIQLIENYEKLIISASTDYTGNGSNYINSTAGVLETRRQNDKKNGVLQSFDGFENFLYTSSSISWPYAGVNRYSSTSSQVLNWYASASISAVSFDNNNPNYVLNNIPQYLFDYDENEQFLLFLSMMGHHFDNIYFYAKSIEKGRNLGYKSNNSVNDKILYDILKSYSWDPKHLDSNLKLWEYSLGLDSNGNTKFLNPSQTRTKEIWRRILNNLPYLLKHRGTKRGIYALLACYGIPSSNLSILEFGGPEVDNTNKGKLVMDELTYVLHMSQSSTITLPWPNTENSRTPDSLEVFFRPLNSGSVSTLLSNTWTLQISASNFWDTKLGKIVWNYGGGTLTSNEFPVYDEYYTGVHLSKKNSNVYLDIAQYSGERVVFTQSLSTAGTWATSTGNVTIGHSTFNGFIDEVRTWSQPLSSSIFFQHSAWPEMTNGNTYSSSTDDLFFRLDFEYPKNVSTYTKVLNVAPHIYYDTGYTRNIVELESTPSTYMNSTNGSAQFSATLTGFSNITTYPYQFETYDRKVSAPIPSIGSSRFVGNKVRNESQTLVSNLSPKYRSTKKAFDQSPIDSNRVGLFFSPNKELNLDIIKTFGGLNFDNYIGDPSYQYDYRYKDLDELREYYFDRYKYSSRNVYEYINLIKLYEKAMFEDIKQMLPARVKASTGLLIEPHILERSKYQHIRPTGSYQDLQDTIDLNNYNVLSETFVKEALVQPFDNTELIGEDNQKETNIDANYGENLVGENTQYDSVVETEDIFRASSLSETGYLESAETSVETNLDEGTPQKEREAFPEVAVVGQNELSDLAFGIYAENGYAVRSYFNRYGGVSKERVLVSILKEQKEREYTYYLEGDDPRSGEAKGTEIYYETRVNIQPFIKPGTTNTPSSFPTTNERIVEVIPLNGYASTHYKNTNDLTTGLEYSYFKGSKNTAATTLDGTPPVEVFATNPNTLRVNKAGRDAAEPILEVE